MLRRQCSHLWHDSWSNLWGWIKVGVGAVALGVQQIGHLVSNSDVKNAIDNLHIDPRIALAIAILGAITIISAEH